MCGPTALLTFLRAGTRLLFFQDFSAGSSPPVFKVPCFLDGCFKMFACHHPHAHLTHGASILCVQATCAYYQKYLTATLCFLLKVCS